LTLSSRNYHIVFYSDREGNREIYVMISDGSGQVNLSHSVDEEGNPDWRWSR
jgi:Tol biopolymer transport system component